MKVMIIPSWYPNDINTNSGIFFKEQAIALNRNSDSNVTILYPEIWPIKSLFQAHLYTDKGFTSKYEEGILTYRYKSINFLPKIPNGVRHIYYICLMKIFKKYVEEYGLPDIIHAHSMLWGGWAATKIAKKYNIPIVITEHSSTYQRNIIKQSQNKYIEYIFDNINQLLVVGPSLKQEMSIRGYKKNIKIIPNIVDISYFKPSDQKKDSRTFRFFSLGILTMVKGMDLLIKAYAKEFKNVSNVELVIGGEGPEKENLIRLVNNLNISSSVSFLGELSREEVVTEMQNCNCFVLSSRTETFGVVYIEALATGKPIIASKSGGPEMIVNNDNGILCEVDNYKDLAKKMRFMYNNINNYKSADIIKDCVERFSSKSVVEELIKVYKEVLK